MKIKKIKAIFESEIRELEIILLEMSDKGLYHSRLSSIVNNLKECECVFDYAEYTDDCNKKIPNKVRKMVGDVFNTPDIQNYV